MLRLALRNLFQNKIRFAISVGGVALALTLILALDAVMVGSKRQLSAYIDHSGADIWISQSGVRQMHMSNSSLPASVVDEVGEIEGVQSATPILFMTNTVVSGDKRFLAYVVGLPEDAPAGGAWDLAVGKGVPGRGEAIIASSVASKAGISIGDSVSVLGRKLRVVGLSEGTVTVINSVALISLEDFRAVRGESDAVSFVLVVAAPGQSVDVMTTRIEGNVPDVTVQTRAETAAQERKVINDMMSDVMAVMNFVGFLIGLAVMALTVYLATFARRSEYGVLRALGARTTDLYRVVIAQALASVVLGFAAGLGITALLAIIASMQSDMDLAISTASLLKVGAISILIAGLSAVLPIKQIAGLDPAMVFRGGSTK